MVLVYSSTHLHAETSSNNKTTPLITNPVF